MEDWSKFLVYQETFLLVLVALDNEARFEYFLTRSLVFDRED